MNDLAALVSAAHEILMFDLVRLLADLPGFDATKITVFGAIAAIADRVARTPVGVSESDPPSIAVVLLGLACCCKTAHKIH